MEATERDEILRKEAERDEKIRRRMEREERRRERKMKKRSLNDDEDHDRRIEEEERKLLVAQRKLESIRLLDELLERVKVVQNASKDVKVSEKDLFKTARVASKLSKNNDVTGLIGKDRDEAELRNKLVSNLKEKEIKKMKECRDKIRNDKLYSDGDERRDRDERRHRIAVAKKAEKVEKLYSSEEEGNLDQVSDEDLRLTSSSENDEEGNGTEDKKKKRKKEKKKKKKKEKEREREKDKERDEEKEDKREKKKRRKELESYTSLAQRIANRDRRSRSPRDRDERDRDERRHGHRESSASAREDRHEQWERQHQRGRTREDELRDRERQHLERQHQRRFERRMAEKNQQQSMDNIYDEMINGSGGYRKLKRGEHYEDVQNKLLANEIRIKERREKYLREELKEDMAHGRMRSRGHVRIQKFHDLQRGRGDSREGSRGRDAREDRQYHPYRRW